jgi:hypothetical protein
VLKNSLRLADDGDKSAVTRRRKFLAMLFVVAILGGLLIMMGQHSRSESLLYYFLGLIALLAMRFLQSPKI